MSGMELLMQEMEYSTGPLRCQYGITKKGKVRDPAISRFRASKTLAKSGFFGTGIEGGIQMVNPVRNRRNGRRKQDERCKEGGSFYRQRYDDKAAGQAAAETDRVPRQGADPL